MRIDRITAFSGMFNLFLSQLSAPMAGKNWNKERTSAGAKIQTGVGCRGWERTINSDSVNSTNMI